MAFAGCGANALDRGLEALAYAYKAMKDVPETAGWQRRFGATAETRLEKRYRLMPRGTSIVITCATFPQWNGYPAILASLSTGQAASQNDAAGRTFRSHDARGPRRIWI
jgi:hypothetical protein